MGIYINPPCMTKERWLKECGRRITADEAKRFQYADPAKEYLVCLLDNGLFTAAGVCYSPQERDAFMVDDGRPRKYYVVLKGDLINTPFSGVAPQQLYL